VVVTWRPGIDASTLRTRSRIYSIIRQFFDDRDVIEVTTPVLGARGVSDLHIESLTLHQGEQTFFLQSSPEYSMKRLLASGSGSIYQICPAFRAGEMGSRHNTEFAMLEWYRVGLSIDDLIMEVSNLVQSLVTAIHGKQIQIEHYSYAELFIGRFGQNPHTATLAELRQLIEQAGLASDHIDNIGDDATSNAYLDLLFSSSIEPELQNPAFVSDFPGSQAALAKKAVNESGDEVARRFEFYWRGVELANGYDELTNAEELGSRFDENNISRTARGLPVVASDEKLLASMSKLPDCAGVAVGLDRLVMLLCEKTSIDEVIAFSQQRL